MADPLNYDGAARHVARELCNDVNNMSFDAVAFADQVRREHPTIQQSVGNVILELLKQWAEDEANHNYDLRNEGICKFAAKVTSTIDPPLRFPHI